MAISLPASSLLAEEVPQNYRAFIDNSDGYSYFYPSDWREFDFRGHDSAFKDRYMQLQNVRVRFLPTTKQDIHELGPMEEVKDGKFFPRYHSTKRKKFELPGSLSL